MPHAGERSRRAFLHEIGSGALATGVVGLASGAEPAPAAWRPISDRRIRVGIAGHGHTGFGARFFFQDHPNVEVVAVTDLDPERRAALAAACRCTTTYPSAEEMFKDARVEAVFLATDAPSHFRLSLLALEHDKHVAVAVPAFFGGDPLEQATRLRDAVKSAGRTYALFETSAFHEACYAFRQRYRAGALGKIVSSEGEYYHFKRKSLPGFNPKTNRVDENGWRKGLPPMWYPTHALAYYVSVTGGRLLDVSCLGMPSDLEPFRDAGNDYRNSFATEVALFHTSEGGMSRMAVSWDTPATVGEMGRVYGQLDNAIPATDSTRPPLPPGTSGGDHGGSHGYLTNDFVESILVSRQPTVPVGDAIHMSLAGAIAHQSALKDGERLKVPLLD